MKYSKLFAVLAVVSTIIFTDCSKSADPVAAKAGGCKVKFDGKDYVLSEAVCSYPNTNYTLSADWYNRKAGVPNILMGINTSEPEFASIYFSDGAIEWTFDKFYGSPPPTITVSGKSWTFSASNLFQGLGTKSISGTCTCTIGP